MQIIDLTTKPEVSSVVAARRLCHWFDIDLKLKVSIETLIHAATILMQQVVLEKFCGLIAADRYRCGKAHDDGSRQFAVGKLAMATELWQYGRI